MSDLNNFECIKNEKKKKKKKERKVIQTQTTKLGAQSGKISNWDRIESKTKTWYRLNS